MITCYLRYVIDPNKIKEFEHYARLWMPLVEKFGGTHHGYFLPGEAPAQAAFSFPGIATQGDPNIAVALFSFPSLADYERYREQAAHDPECQAAMAYYEQTKCFVSYERNFMQPLFKQ